SNTVLGYQALNNNTQGDSNTAVGHMALQANTNNKNSAFGASALNSNTVGYNNVAVGYAALVSNISGYGNTAIGYQAMSSTQGSGYYNVAIGNIALLSNTSGNDNVAVGGSSLWGNTTGNNNTAVGYGALQNANGQNNVAIGTGALQDVTNGSNNVAIGSGAGTATSPVDIQGQSNLIVLGNSSTTDMYVSGNIRTTDGDVFARGVQLTSDVRDKTAFSPVSLGLDFILKLKPTAYQFKQSRKDIAPVKNGKVHYGFLAQDILALEGPQPVIINNQNPDHLMFEEVSLVAVLVNALQEMNRQNQELQNKIEKLNARLVRLEAKEGK
ncbi:MAG: tail fiber domain-containing protein, partial [Candidatus Omnitrophica bacterium]|nr:tail fiber domain-containing protein [Candidatus Omnitrophota bacterium]